MNNGSVCEKKNLFSSSNLTLPIIYQYKEVAILPMKEHHRCGRFCIPLNCCFPTSMYRYSQHIRVHKLKSTNIPRCAVISTGCQTFSLLQSKGKLCILSEWGLSVIIRGLLPDGSMYCRHFANYISSHQHLETSMESLQTRLKPSRVLKIHFDERT